jgi:exopolysaccharide biosynthesis polyprenyl glycosylphosphotransferase
MIQYFLMISKRRIETSLLFLGDLFFFGLSLWLALFARYAEFPSFDLFLTHVRPFTILFAAWVFVFFVAGLYEKHTLILRNRVPVTILNAQIINSIIGALFFYLIPYFGIAPKTLLFVYLLISFFFILVWRIYGEHLFKRKDREKAILIGGGEEMRELFLEVNNNSRYDICFVSSVDVNDMESLDFNDEIVQRIYAENINVIVADVTHDKVVPILPKLYNLMFSNTRFIDMHKIYEDIFDRIPLSLVSYSWFLENISTSRKSLYDVLKRIMDMVFAIIFGLISLIFYPFIILAIKLEDGGAVFFSQERIGKNNQIIKIHKFRSMRAHTSPDGIAEKPVVTRVGKFLRASSLDELPQLWSVFKGDLSLIGPRPEIPALAKVYEKEVPYYNIRHLIKPGLSGWAQLYQKAPPKFEAQVDQTKKKLSYDLFYIKNRSLFLDIVIALKTLKAVMFRKGA